MNPDLARTLLLGHAGVMAALSIATFIAYGIDKRRAKKKLRRIPERTLHRFSWLGGVAGGWLGRQGFRHKTQKRGFAVRLTAATLLHLALSGSLAWFAFT